MKKIFLVLILSLLGTSIGFAEVKISEKVLSVDHTAGYDYSISASEESITYVPKEWGNLVGVTAHGGSDILYFQASDGNIYVMQGKPVSGGEFYFHNAQGASKIIRK